MRELHADAFTEEPARPDEVVARVAEQRRVAQLVMELEEPYRSTVLLAFWDGLAPSEIAQRTGAPVETVRTRTKRALAQLRGRLAAEHRRDGRAWALAVLPVAGWTHGEVAAAVAAAAGTALPGATGAALTAKGVLVMASTKKSVVLVAAVALLAGVLGTVGVQSALQSARTQRPERDTAVAPDPADRRAAAAQPARARRPSDSFVATTQPAGGPAPAAQTTAAASGDITGRIALADGSPVAGVTVRAMVRRAEDDWTWRAGEAPPDPAAAAERIRAAAERARLDEETSRWTVTDAEGRFRFADVGRAEHWLRAWKEGYSFMRTAQAGMTNAFAGDRVDFDATRLAAIDASVLAPDGSPLAEATLRVESTDGKATTISEVRWSRARPHVWVAPGTLRVTAFGGPGGVWASSAAELRLEAGAHAPPTEFRLHPRLGLRGRILAPPGFRVSWATLRLRHLAAGETPDDDALLKGGRSEWFGPGRGMQYEFLDLVPGTYHLGLVLADNALVWSTTVEVERAIVPFDVQVPAPTPERFVAVRAEAPDGSPLADFRVNASLRVGNASSGFGVEGLRGDDGAVWVPRRTIHGDIDDADECRFTVSAPDYGTKSGTLSSRNPDGVTVRFAAPGRLDVALPDGTPADLAQALRLQLDRRERSGSWGGFQPRDAADGHWRTGPLEPGEYVVRVRVEGPDGMDHEVLARDVTVVAATQHVTLSLPPLRTVIVRAPGTPRGTTLRLEPDVREARSQSLRASTDRDGTATFRWVPDGVYRVFVPGRRAASREDVPRIEVTGETDVTLDR